ncbi:hypothetical protein TL16_g07043 [Triparma laevis f. inornata]|uniref:Uncharacterized protein n=1 Tax=Triparma laevis f. inornata TaxID=1714386 RepID=A0A9W7EEZ3_9STRA|nr:hypothetical protein TL16_g07043 [Triparma laevis f. inornata]
MDSQRAFRQLFTSLHRKGSAGSISANADPLKAHLIPVPSHQRLAANVLDTIIIEHGDPAEWLFSSKEGLVLKKKDGNCNWKAIRQAFRRNSKLYPSKSVAILRFASSSPGLSTRIISTTSTFESLQTDLTAEAMHRLVAVQMYAFELATPRTGVFQCNYTCDVKGKTNYTSVGVKKWPEKQEAKSKDEAGVNIGGEGGDGDSISVESSVSSGNYTTVQPWRHNSMIQAVRSIVSYSEKTTNHSIESVTLEFMFDPSTAQPVLLGVVELNLGGNLTEMEKLINRIISYTHKDEIHDEIHRSNTKEKNKTNKRNQLKPAARANGADEYFDCSSYKFHKGFFREPTTYGTGKTPMNSRTTSPETIGSNKDMTSATFDFNPTPVDLNPAAYHYTESGSGTGAHVCRGKYCHMFGKKEGEVLCGADIHTPCVGYRTLALAKVEERFDEGKGLMERFAGRMTEMGIKRDEAWDEEAILADVVDERLRKILEQCQVHALEMFSKSMRISMGVDRKWELYDFELASRKTKYNEALRHIPPARAYDQVPVCKTCNLIYNMLDQRRENIFDLTEKGGGLGGGGKKAPTGGGGRKQWKKSIGHYLGVGNQKGLNHLTPQEERAGEARKRLLQRKEAEIVEMERRYAAAVAKKKASTWTKRTPVASSKKKTQGGKKRDAATVGGVITGHDSGGAPNINPEPIPNPPQASNHALVITSGDIGFDGKKFIFRPPSIPRQLALSDVRKAGFVAQRVQAEIGAREQQMSSGLDTQDTRKSLNNNNTMTVSVALPTGETIVRGTKDGGGGGGDVDPFDVLKPLPMMLDSKGGMGNIEEGEEQNRYSFLDSPFTLDQLGGGGSGGGGKGDLLSSGHGIYEPEEEEEIDFRNNQSMEMMRELDDLRSFSLALKPLPKEKKEVVEEKKVIKAVKIEKKVKVEEKMEEPTIPLAGGEYIEDFDDDEGESNVEEKVDWAKVEEQVEEKQPFLSEPEPEPFLPEPKGGEAEEAPYADDFAEDDSESVASKGSELTMNSDNMVVTGDADKDDSFESTVSEQQAKLLPGFSPSQAVPLGVLSGGEGTNVDLPPWETEESVGRPPPKKALPSGDFLSEIAQLKADAKALNNKFGV